MEYRNRKTALTFLVGLCLTLVSFSEEKNRSSIEVRISGLKELKGQIIVNVYTSSIGFPTKPELSYKEFKIPIINVNPNITIDLPVGEYAIAVFQDENLDDKLNTNFFNIPTEKAGVSNNPTALIIPSYEDAKFTLSISEITKNIYIK